jgi:hypothetical protein
MVKQLLIFGWQMQLRRFAPLVQTQLFLLPVKHRVRFLRFQRQGVSLMEQSTL